MSGRRLKRLVALVTTSVLALALPVAEVLPAQAATSLGTVTIDGKANIFNAGHPTPVLGGLPALQVRLPAGSAGQAITISNASGGVTQGVNAPSPSPDGGYDPDLSVNITSLAGISGVVGDPGLGGFLAGVFTSDQEPIDPAPPSLDYTAATGQLTLTQMSYRPLVNQQFFMGDGRTVTGATQQFVVPAGATSLWLGLDDAGFYQGSPISSAGDTGSYVATLGLQPSLPPPLQPDFRLTVTPSSGTAVTTFQAKYRAINCADGKPPTETLADATGSPVNPLYVATGRFSGAGRNGQFVFQNFKAGQLGVLSPELLCNGVVAARATINISSNTYVALGDSYSAGEGGSLGDFDPTTKANIGPNGTSSGCHRASTGYANEVAAYYQGKAASWTFAACSGAETKDFYQINSSYAPFEVELPQLEGIDPNHTKLVTLTDGGNDVGFATIMAACVFGRDADGTPGCTDPNSNLAKYPDPSSVCGCGVLVNLYDYVYGNITALTDGGVCVSVGRENCDSGASLLTETPGTRTLSQLYVDIAKRVSPGGRVVVGGYPEFFGGDNRYYKKVSASESPSGYRCQVGTVAGSRSLSVDYADAVRIAQFAVDGNKAIAAQVANANTVLKASGSSVQVIYASGVDKAFDFHRLCDKQSPWLNGAQVDTFRQQPRQTSFHPNISGQHAYARAFEEVITKLN